MDNPLTRAEHEEFRKTVNADIKRLDAEDARLNKRLTELENGNHQIQELTVNVQKLTDSIEHMRQLQEDEGNRLKAIEGRDGEMWRKVVSYILTAVISVIVGVIFSNIGM